VSQFYADRVTEQKGLKLAEQLLAGLSDGTPLKWTNDFYDAEFWQRTHGDVIYTSRIDGRHRTVEIKTEKKWRGNLFVETWSNCAWGRQRPGWSATQVSSELLTIWLDVMKAYKVESRNLFAWFYEMGNGRRFNEVVPYQCLKGVQKNVTKGVPVPLDVLAKSCGGLFFQHDGTKWNIIDHMSEKAA
jgi:hypothetical protein